ncbi:MAG: phenylalanine--tRNA ligase subunit beta [Longimicrobiales bacterium]|nr:phenylalanine--tRNA ligase subunit beta [Longimicrobiales bacterium]
MNISYRWIRELVPGLSDTPEVVAERLALLGFPVEGLHPLASGLDDIVVARVLEAGPHPDADRLSLCRVDAGTGEALQVVCGAPNVRAGACYPFVPVGGTLPDGTRIRKAKIRGQHSFGMLCSPRELGLGADHAGILELGVSDPPGTPFVAALGLDDVRLDVEVTSNRGDLLCHLGVARELAPDGPAAGDGPGLSPIPDAPEVAFTLRSHPERVEVEGVVVRTEAPERCRRFLGALVRGVRVGPSPDWLQTRLRAVGLRPINNVVDATNYVLMELGQPLHAYDLAALSGPEVVVRMASRGEAVRTLDGEDRTLDADMLVIADAERTVDVAGIMGDEGSSVTAETTDVFLECAHFDPPGIRNTRKVLGIASDAGYRFERFVDPDGQERALARCLALILATAGGELHPVVADVHPRPWTDSTVTLRLARVERVLGVPFRAEAVTALLTPLGFRCAPGAGPDTLSVTVPSWRGADVTREVDLIEEVARRHGFHRFPDTLGAFRPGTVPDHPLFRLEDRLRDVLCARGFLEAQTPAFVPEAEGEVRLQNPLSHEEPVLRRRLLPSLLRRLAYNLARGNRDVRLFELGTSFSATPEGELPAEEPRLTLVLTGARTPPHWSASSEAVDIWDLKGILQAVAETAWGPEAEVAPGGGDAFPGVPGLTLTVTGPEGRPLGTGGVVAPAGLDLPPWAGTVLGLEMTLPAEPRDRPAPTARPLPAYPPVDRDLALVVPDAVPASDVEALARATAGEALESVQIFDLYRGEGIPSGTRSLALRFRFRHAQRTLTDDEVDHATRRITDRLAEEWGVHVRGA